VNRRIFRYLIPVLGLTIFVLAAWTLRREMEHLQWQKVKTAFTGLPVERVALSLVLAVLGYIVLTGYDLLGVRYVGQSVPNRRVLFASFVSYVFTNNVGLSLFGAVAVRMRLYTRWGLSVPDVIRLAVFAGFTAWIGVVSLCGITLLLFAVKLPGNWSVSSLYVRLLGATLLLAVSAYLIACARVRKSLNIRGFSFSLPPIRLAAFQPLVGMFDWGLAAASLYVLLPRGSSLPFTTFLTSYAAAQTVGIFSNVPGALGVFEGVLILTLKQHMPVDSLLGALLAYRLIYYLLPLIVGLTLMGVYELALRIFPRAKTR